VKKLHVNVYGQYLAPNSTGCKCPPGFLTGYTKHRWVIPCLSRSATYSLIIFKLLEPQAGDPHVKTKKGTYWTCVPYLDIMKTSCQDMENICLSIRWDIYYSTFSIYPKIFIYIKMWKYVSLGDINPYIQAIIVVTLMLHWFSWA
jgi:hypothetical protein